MLRTVSATANLSRYVHGALDGCLRQLTDLYNASLAERKDAYERTGRKVSYLDQQTSLTRLRQTDQTWQRYSVEVQRSPLRRLDRAYKRFFKMGGYPRFKSERRGIRSFEISSVPKVYDAGRRKRITIKGIGNFIFDRKLPDGDIKVLRVVKTARRVVLQFVIDVPELHVIDRRDPVGIDMGIRSRMTLSTGEQESKRVIDRKGIVRRQRKVSKAQRGSNNRKKRVLELRKEWQRVSEKERGYLHELTARLVKEVSGRFVLENLSIQNMMKRHATARSIAEQQWYTFRNMLTYKAESASGWVATVDPKYTTQLCSACGALADPPIGEGVRMYQCPCGHEEDRDVNAAKNILRKGLALVSGGDVPEMQGVENPNRVSGWTLSRPVGLVTA